VVGLETQGYICSREERWGLDRRFVFSLSCEGWVTEGKKWNGAFECNVNENAMKWSFSITRVTALK
jgi:hypothetical protein